MSHLGALMVCVPDNCFIEMGRFPVNIHNAHANSRSKTCISKTCSKHINHSLLPSI